MDIDSHPLVLFDGVCGLCNRSVDFILQHDPHGTFRFAPQQSDLGQAVLREHGIDPHALESLVVVADGRAAERSDAVVAICQHLGWPWRAMAVLAWLPRPIRDGLYNIVARNRYRWFGKQDACRMPQPGETERFLA